jgi:hypothetical protein
VESVEIGFSRPLALRTSGGRRDGEATPHLAVVPTTDSVVRDVRVVCCRARGNSHLQKPQKRTRPAKSSRTAMPGTRSSRGFRTSMNTCGDCSRWPTRAIAPLNATFERGPGQWSPEVEGTSSQRTSVALTCPDRTCLGGWDLERFRSHRTQALQRCQRVSFGKAASADNAGTAFDMRESASQQPARRPATAPQRQRVSAE